MTSRLLYGGDYNPDQWMHVPGIWDEDIRLMDLAHINSASIGIFSWVSLEPEEGRFEFGWLDDVVDRLTSAGKSIIMATPSGAKPAWMAEKYPEIRRCTDDGRREPQQERHNHCPTSPVSRKKVAEINRRLAGRYGSLPNVVLWHLSNEYSGYCYCELCRDAFRTWLKAKYATLDALNNAWWTRFWSHTFTDWGQIVKVDYAMHGMVLDWRRFMTDQCVDFMRHEIAAVRSAAPNARFTTNMMGTHEDLNCWKIAPYLDVISLDRYPDWHSERPDWTVGASVGFVDDLNRSLKGGTPWLLMETTPSAVNWKPVSRPLRPGALALNGMAAIAHGAEGVCYFQFRKGRGGCEKFHGAVVDHAGHENTRVFREAAAFGSDLQKLAAVAGTRTDASVALIYDWENCWAINTIGLPRNRGKNYQATVEAHYLPFWKRGIAVDVIDSTVDLSRYSLVVAPMLYMLRPGVAESISRFVERGGTFVATYLTGVADENDLCFLGGFPGPLREVLGIWAEELDALHDSQTQMVNALAGDAGLTGGYAAREFCEVIHAETAKPLAVYGSDYYAGMPAVTVNDYGKGRAYYIASRNDERFTDDLLAAVANAAGVKSVLDSPLPLGVSAHTRTGECGTYLFLLNFNAELASVDIPHGWKPLVGPAVTSGQVELPTYGVSVLHAES